MYLFLIIMAVFTSLVGCSNQTPFYGEYTEPPVDSSSIQASEKFVSLAEGDLIQCNDANAKPLIAPAPGHMILRFAVPITATAGSVSTRGHYYCADRTIKMLGSDCSLVEETKAGNADLNALLIEHLYSNDVLGALLTNMYHYSQVSIGVWRKTTGPLTEEAKSYVLLGGLCSK